MREHALFKFVLVDAKLCVYVRETMLFLSQGFAIVNSAPPARARARARACPCEP
jgi:hypothetical protein